MFNLKDEELANLIVYNPMHFSLDDDNTCDGIG